MNLEKLSSLVSRVFFFGAFLLLAVAILKKLMDALGFQLTVIDTDPSRLLEFASILLIFVLALLLREVREGLKKS